MTGPTIWERMVAMNGATDPVDADQRLRTFFNWYDEPADGYDAEEKTGNATARAVRRRAAEDKMMAEWMTWQAGWAARLRLTEQEREGEQNGR